MLRVLSEFLWSLRRRGIELAVSEAIDAARAVRLIGFSDPGELADALACVVVKRREDRAAFDQAFREFFSTTAAHGSDLRGRLLASGFSSLEVAALEELVRALSQQSGAGDLQVLSALGRGEDAISALLRLASVRRLTGQATQPGAAFVTTERIAQELGLQHSATLLGRIEQALSETMGTERAAALRAQLEQELRWFRRRVRQHVDEAIVRLGDSRPDVSRPSAQDRPFADLAPEEAAALRRALVELGRRLARAHGPRTARARRGRVAVARTLRAAMHSGAVPIRLARRGRSLRRPKLVLLCDVSESVRHAARFMLHFVAAAQAMFEQTRTFVFRSDAREVTALLARASPERAASELARGGLLDVSQNSNYGRALRAIEHELKGKIDRRTLVVLLGDGRSNHQSDGAEVLGRLRQTSRGVLLLCPEDPSAWGLGDSAMWRFARQVTEVIPVRSPRELEHAVRRLRRFA